MGIDREWEQSAKRVAKSFHKNSWHNKMYEMLKRELADLRLKVHNMNGAGAHLAIATADLEQENKIMHKALQQIRRHARPDDPTNERRKLHDIYRIADKSLKKGGERNG